MMSNNKNIFFWEAVIICFILSAGIFAQNESVKQLKQNVKEVIDKNNNMSKDDPWTMKSVITVDELSSRMKKHDSTGFVIYQVGFSNLYSQGHVRNAIYAGPGLKDEGIKKLVSAVKNVPHDKEIILYCGCCKWVDCPNIRPAFEALNKMGYKKIKVLYLPDNFTIDWINKGLPVEK